MNNYFLLLLFLVFQFFLHSFIYPKKTILKTLQLYKNCRANKSRVKHPRALLTARRRNRARARRAARAREAGSRVEGETRKTRRALSARRAMCTAPAFETRRCRSLEFTYRRFLEHRAFSIAPSRLRESPSTSNVQTSSRSFLRPSVFSSSSRDLWVIPLYPFATIKQSVPRIEGS